MDERDYKAINKHENGNEVLADVSSRACLFAEWLQEKRWFSFIDGKWHYTFEQGTAMSRKTYEKNYMKTTQELYTIFCSQHGY
jgi:hypothetical protein